MRNALILAAILLITGVAMAEEAGLAKELEPLRPFIGKTWRGEFKSSTAENPLIDVARWERAMNGEAVRIVHSMNDGVYGGESIIRWDAKRNTIEFYYFTTASFMTHGTMEVKDGKLLTHEKVDSAPGGVTEVKAVFELLPDRKMRVTTQHLKDGKWEPGREVNYTEAPGAQVTFK